MDQPDSNKPEPVGKSYPPNPLGRVWWVVLGLIVGGIGFRLWRVLVGYPMRIDEIRLAINVRDRGFAELAQPLDHAQGAPVGFLWLSKIATSVLGDTDFAYRLVPLLASIGTLLLIPFIARRLVGKAGVVFVTALVAVSPWAVQYASDFKQYPVDTLFTAALLLAGLICIAPKATWRARLVFATIGSAAIFCSHPAMFVTAGTGLTLGILAIIRKDRPAILQLLATAAVWAGTLALLWAVNLRHLSGRDDLMRYWDADFMPIPPTTAVEWRWFIRTFFEWNNTVGYYFNPILMLLIGLGLVWLFVRQRVAGVMLFSLTLLTLAACAAREYPFANRMIYFLMPATVMFAAVGFERAVVVMNGAFFHVKDRMTNSRPEGRASVPSPFGEMVGLGLVVFLFVATLPFTQVVQPWMGGRFDLKILMRHAERKYQGEPVICEIALWYPWGWYDDASPLPNTGQAKFSTMRFPREPGDEYTAPLLEAIHGQERVWIFAADQIWGGRDPDRPYLGVMHDTRDATEKMLAEHGRIVDRLDGANASVYLFEPTSSTDTAGRGN